jgi:hypothetical protein
MMIKIHEETYVHAITIILHNEEILMTLLISGFVGVFCIIIGFFYSTYFSYPSIQRDCSSFVTGKPLGSPKRKRKFSGYQYHKNQLHSQYGNYRTNPLSLHHRQPENIPYSPMKNQTQESTRRTVLSSERSKPSEY